MELVLVSSYDLQRLSDADRSSENVRLITDDALRNEKDENVTRVSLSAGNYRTQLYDKQREEYLPATQGLGMFVEVKDPDDKVSEKTEEGRP